MAWGGQPTRISPEPRMRCQRRESVSATTVPTSTHSSTGLGHCLCHGEPAGSNLRFADTLQRSVNSAILSSSVSPPRLQASTLCLHLFGWPQSITVLLVIYLRPSTNGKANCTSNTINAESSVFWFNTNGLRGVVWESCHHLRYAGDCSEFQTPNSQTNPLSEHIRT